MENTVQITGIQIQHILFDHSHQAVIEGFTIIAQEKVGVQLQISFSMLNDLLRLNGKLGDAVVMAMADRIINEAQPPYHLDIYEITQGKNILTGCTLGLVSRGETRYQIIEIFPTNLIQQSKNLALHIKHFGQAELTQNAVSSQKIIGLKDQYTYYLSLKELDIHDDAARLRAQLGDERLFLLAKLAATNS
jgi:hypothetical protein